MMRTLRALTLAALLVLGSYMVLVRAIIAGAFSPYNGVNLLTVLLVKDLLGRTGFALAFAAGVVAVVATLQRRQRGWTVVVLVLLVLAPYSFYLANYLLRLRRMGYGVPQLDPLRDLSFAQDVVAIVLALVVLAYSFLGRSATSAIAPGRADGEILPPAAPTAES
jgi:ABC-type transport system involved in cytochrome c biogenesis permease subunit